MAEVTICSDFGAPQNKMFWEGWFNSSKKLHFQCLITSQQTCESVADQNGAYDSSFDRKHRPMGNIRLDQSHMFAYGSPDTSPEHGIGMLRSGAKKYITLSRTESITSTDCFWKYHIWFWPWSLRCPHPVVQRAFLNFILIIIYLFLAVLGVHCYE